MSLKDYHALVDQFWKEKSTKTIKEKSAFEPYHCYRPYMMDYHDRGCRKYHDSHDDVHKYKMHSPKCDQCEYHELKRKSSNSSLENIVLKLKKSRNDDKETRHFSPQVIEKLVDHTPHSPYKSPPPITMCPRIVRDRSPVERCIPSVDRSMSSIERSLPSERSMPSVERSMSSIERSLPPVERSLPLVDRSLPLVERSLSSVDRHLPSVERTLSSIERSLPPVERSMPSIERSHDLPRVIYSSEERDKLIDKYNNNHISSSDTALSELNDSNEKSSFVTLLEQQDDIQYASTLSMASILGSNPSKKLDEKPISDKGEKEKPKCISPTVPTSTVKHINAGEDNNMNLYNTDDKNDSSDKIAETKCDKCHKRFYRKSQLIRHISNHVVHECHKCNAFFYCVRKFKKHMSTHESYPCEFCEEEFYEASAWYHHRAKHTMVECSSCDMIFYNKTALLKHKFTHLQYICPVCRFPFSNLNHWISHRSCHKTFGSTLLTPLFSCRECSTTFPSQDTYMKHTCLHRQKKTRDPQRPIMSKRDISDLIGVDQTAK